MGLSPMLLPIIASYEGAALAHHGGVTGAVAPMDAVPVAADVMC